MLTYELARKLKDAGFQQHITSYYACQHCKDWDTCIVKGDCEPAMIPTLSELIEACEWRMSLLWQTTYDEEDETSNKTIWYAGTITDPKLGSGSTPEEALASLWLALNQSK